MKFNVGDRVLIVCDHVPGISYKTIPPGTIGIVTQVNLNSYRVELPDDKDWGFLPEHVSSPIPEEHTLMSPPDMELDEIERAEEIKSRRDHGRANQMSEADTLASKLVNLSKLEDTLSEDILREMDHAGWMAQLILKLPQDRGWKGLSPALREEIEQIITAVE